MNSPRSIQSLPEDGSDLNLWHSGTGHPPFAAQAQDLEVSRATTATMATMQKSSDSDETRKYASARNHMVERQISRRGIRDSVVLEAMRQVPRHLFVPKKLRHLAYEDRPLPIGRDQTISQPYIVALMTQLLKPTGRERVLEIGTGSGYHAAVLSRAVKEVYSLEVVEELGRKAERLLDELGYDNVHVRVDDGYDGWPEEAPFDAILLAAAPEELPEPLVHQLRPGGRIILPLGDRDQELQVLTKTDQGLLRERILPVRFVPMTGKARKDSVS